MRKLFYNIGKLVQTESGELLRRRSGAEMADLNILEKAYMLTDEEKIAGFGYMVDLTEDKVRDMMADESIDVKGRMILPAFAILILTWFMQEAGK
jgi:imidazolonepropionase-like amidohydrolase